MQLALPSPSKQREGKEAKDTKPTCMANMVLEKGYYLGHLSLLSTGTQIRVHRSQGTQIRPPILRTNHT